DGSLMCATAGPGGVPGAAVVRCRGRRSAEGCLGAGGGPGGGQGAQGAGVGDGVLPGDARLDAERGQAGAVAEVEEHPGVAGAQVHLDDLRPLQTAAGDDVDDGDAGLVALDAGPGEQV